MILKKPYAFLVKHFRMIHIVLLACMSYLVYNTWNLSSFLSEYIRSNQQVFGIALEDLSSNYVPGTLYLLSFIIIILTGIIIYLMRYKKKPILFYLVILTIYIIVLISFFYASSFLNSLQIELPDLRFVNIVRDIYRALFYVQIPIIAITVVRAIGFDVRKFDFKKDLLDLGIEDEDNEEYEVEFSLDSEEVKAKTKKGIRLFKYFYKENKFLFVILGVSLLTIFTTFVIYSFVTREKIYSQGTKIDIGTFNAEIIETYKTNTDAKGNRINSKYFYLIAKIRVQNKSNVNTTFNKGIIRLSYGENGNIVPTSEYNSKFTEFGVGYFSQIINAKETRDFIFIFEVPIEYYNDTFTLKYLMNIKYNNGKLDYNYKKVALKPIEFAKDKTIKDTKHLGEELVFTDSLLGNTKIVINEIQFADSFNYDTVKCSNGNCVTRNNFIIAKQGGSFDLTLMRINYSISFDNETLGKKYNNKKFFTNFCTIRFEINGKEYNNRVELTDVTPYPTNNYSFVQVRDKLKSADKIYLDFNIRDKVYTYVIRDNTVKEGE